MTSSSNPRQQAAFIWTPDQPVDFAAYGRMMHRGTQRRSDGENRWYYLRRSFDLVDRPHAASLSFTVDGRYKLFVNGEFVGVGPARSSPDYKRVDNYDVTALLKSGENVIAVIAYVPGFDLAFHQAALGHWQPVFGDGGVWAVLEAQTGKTTTTIKTDASWKILRATDRKAEAPLQGWGQGHFENLTATPDLSGWMDPHFDDSAWPFAREMIAHGTTSDQAIGREVIRPFPRLRPSGMPALAQTELRPIAVHWHGAVEPPEESALPAALFELEPVTETAPQSGKTANWQMQSSDTTSAAIVFSFDYHTGFPRVEIEAKGGEIIDLAASERLPGELAPNGPGLLSASGPHAPMPAMRYTAIPGVQVIEPFNWAALRALQIVVSNAPEGISIRQVSSRSVRYAADVAGAFECSDPLLNKLWDKGVTTAKWCMHDSWEDCPSREKRQWLADAVMAFRIGAVVLGSSVFPLHKAFIEETVLAQRTDGLFQMFAPGDHGQNGVVIPDFSFHFVRSLKDFLDAGGDPTTAENALHAVERFFSSLESHRNTAGLLQDMPEWHFIEWANVGRMGQAGPLNALYAAALLDGSDLAARFDRPRLADRWRCEAEAVVSGLERDHWDEQLGVYVDEFCPITKTPGRRVSQHLNAMMIAFGFAPAHRWCRILDHVTDCDRVRVTSAPPIVPEGAEFDEDEHVVAVNTMFIPVLCDALVAAGRADAALDHLRRTYREMVEAPTQTLWESYSAGASLCHVFSASPLRLFADTLLGVRIIDASAGTIAIHIQSAGLEWACGTVPTPHGPVEIDWQCHGEEIALKLKAPDSVTIADVSFAGHSQSRATSDAIYFVPDEATTESV